MLLEEILLMTITQAALLRTPITNHRRQDYKADEYYKDRCDSEEVEVVSVATLVHLGGHTLVSVVTWST